MMFHLRRLLSLSLGQVDVGPWALFIAISLHLSPVSSPFHLDIQNGVQALGATPKLEDTVIQVNAADVSGCPISIGTYRRLPHSRIVRSKVVIRDFPPGCGPLAVPKREDSVHLQSNVSPRKYRTYKPRLVSAVRDFPPFCGRDARLPRNGRKMSSKVSTLIHDISKGTERIPICVINSVDGEIPHPFTYVARMKYPGRHCCIPSKGCDCTDGCPGSWECLCLWKNSRGMPYDDHGAILTRKRYVYECGFTCKCPATCRNRATQHGIQFHFQIFRTKDKGWGVRSADSIASGSFICEYTGELLTHEEAEKRIEKDDYLFDLKDGDFSIDARLMGNIGRFVNHSCSPNLYAQNVYYDHDDKRIPHIMLFAAVDIPPMEELTYDYNYKLGKVYDKNGNMRKKACKCGSLKCRGRMY